MLTETRRRRARAALTDRACARRNWRGARATSSVDGWVSMALRSHVVEAAGVRYSERRRAWADSSKRASERAGRRAASESGRRTTRHGLMTR